MIIASLSRTELFFVFVKICKIYLRTIRRVVWGLRLSDSVSDKESKTIYSSA